jgi:hypothetical protein
MRLRFDGSDNAYFAATILVGVSYILFFLPLVIVAANQSGIGYIEALLLIELPEATQHAFSDSWFPRLSWQQDLMLIASLGMLYGVLAICGLLIDLVRTPYKLLFLITSLNAVFWGYVLTLLFADIILETISVTWKSLRLYVFKFIYIYLLFLLIEVAKSRMPAQQVWQPKYEILLDGMFGLLSCYVLLVGFDPELLDILLGPVFLIAMFLVMFLFEHTVLRANLALLVAMSRIHKWAKKNGRENLGAKSMLAELWKRWVRAAAGPIDRSVQYLSRRFRDVDDPLPPPPEGMIRVDSALFLVTTTILGLWPIVIGLVYWLVSSLF